MNPSEEYLDVVKKIFVLFTDCKLSFNDELKSITLLQDAIVTEQNKRGVDLTRDKLDHQLFHILKKNPETGKYESIIRTTQKEWKERLSNEGENINFIGNMCLVLFYQYWEDNYKDKIAKKLGLSNKDKLKSELFCDINQYRKSIIHHNSIALREINKCTILKWFTEGEEIIIDDQMMEELFLLIEKEINKFM